MRNKTLRSLQISWNSAIFAIIRCRILFMDRILDYLCKNLGTKSKSEAKLFVFGYVILFFIETYFTSHFKGSFFFTFLPFLIILISYTAITGLLSFSGITLKVKIIFGVLLFVTSVLLLFASMICQDEFSPLPIHIWIRIVVFCWIWHG